jgi:hypothetical protein
MSDSRFDAHLQALFDEPPPFADQARFVSGVERRIARGLLMRDLCIGGFGLAGGLFLGERVLAAGRAADGLIGGARRAGAVLVGLSVQAADVLRLPSAEGAMVWMIAALGAAGLALVLDGSSREV